jgi:acylphosphatase
VTGPDAGRSTVRRRVVVSGQVQGVFFRDTCRREAVRRGVTGWVRNCPDGTVEAVFEGAPEAVSAMIAWAWRGPSGAVVDDVRTNDEDPEGIQGFTSR